MNTPCPWDALLEARDALTATAQSGRMALPTRLLLCEDLLRLYRAMTAAMQEYGALQEKYTTLLLRAGAQAERMTAALRSERDALLMVREARARAVDMGRAIAALAWMNVVHGAAGLED
jgi:hypothetical protein